MVFIYVLLLFIVYECSIKFIIMWLYILYFNIVDLFRFVSESNVGFSNIGE